MIEAARAAGAEVLEGLVEHAAEFRRLARLVVQLRDAPGVRDAGAHADLHLRAEHAAEDGRKVLCPAQSGAQSLGAAAEQRHIHPADGRAVALEGVPVEILHHVADNEFEQGEVV